MKTMTDHSVSIKCDCGEEFDTLEEHEEHVQDKLGQHRDALENALRDRPWGVDNIEQRGTKYLVDLAGSAIPKVSGKTLRSIRAAGYDVTAWYFDPSKSEADGAMRIWIREKASP